MVSRLNDTGSQPLRLSAMPWDIGLDSS